MAYTIKQIADMAGVTQRTLRHYDQIGLLCPQQRSEARYRLYGAQDLRRLQQILLFRELDFSLEGIRGLLGAPGYNRKEALKMQAAALEQRAVRYHALAKLARATMAELERGQEMDNTELFAAFEYDKMMEQQKQYETEVQQRWGSGKEYAVSKKRVAKLTKEDWAVMNETNEKNLRELADCYAQKLPATHERVQAMVESARLYIHENFYPCSPAMMGELGNMYVMDERFTAYYDTLAPGLAVYYNAAIQAYCAAKAD